MYQEYGDKRVNDFTERDLFYLEESSTIADAATEMRKKGISSVLVKSSGTGKPIGIVTERDILYRVVAEHKSPFKTLLNQVMSTPLITIDESARVGEAVVLMRANGIRRLPTTHHGEITGILTLKTVYGNSHEKKVELLDVELPAAIVCPYCQSKFENKEDLSKHIDRLHLGSGLLEGDLRRW